MLPVTNFKSHDATVEYFYFEAAQNRLEVHIWEDESDGPRTVNKKLVFAEIINVGAVQQFHERIKRVLRKERRRELDYRINDFQQGNTSALKQNTLHFELEIDHLGMLLINCRKFKIYNIDSAGDKKLLK